MRKIFVKPRITQYPQISNIFFFVTNFHYLCYMIIELGLTNGPILGFALNYADEEYPYDELVFYFILAHITFKWNM